MSACGQRGREEDVVGGSLVISVGEAGLSAPAAQRLVRKGALQRSPWRLKRERVKKMGSCRPKWRSPGLPESFLTGSLCGVSPGLSIMISFLRSSSMVLLYVRRGERRSLSDARRRGCPKTFLEFASTCLQAAETERFGGLDFFFN